MKRNFNDMFSGYPSGVFKIIKAALEKYCRRPRNRSRHENFMLCQGFELSDADFKRMEGGGFDASFEVVSYEYFADEFVPKAVMFINIGGNEASIRISSTLAHVHDSIMD